MTSKCKKDAERKTPGARGKPRGRLGYQSFNLLLEDAAQRELLEIQKDEKSGGYIIIGFGPKA